GGGGRAGGGRGGGGRGGGGGGGDGRRRGPGRGEHRWVGAVRLRLRAHRCSTAHLRAAYPFMSAGGMGGEGVYIGADRLGGSFSYDPWALYPDRRRGYAGVITGPNMLVAGQVGRRKSSLVKTYCWRQHVFGRKL